MADLEIEDAGATILECVVNGVTYRLDLAEADDMVRAVDRKHARDLWSCRACWQEFPVSAEQLSLRHEAVQAKKAAGETWVAERDEVPCGHCGSRDVAPPQAFLDSVSRALNAKWGIPYLTRRGAWAFYAKILEAVDGLKKKNIDSLASHSGLEESTVAPSAK